MIELFSRESVFSMQSEHQNGSDIDSYKAYNHFALALLRFKYTELNPWFFELKENSTMKASDDYIYPKALITTVPYILAYKLIRAEVTS